MRRITWRFLEGRLKFPNFNHQDLWEIEIYVAKRFATWQLCKQNSRRNHFQLEQEDAPRYTCMKAFELPKEVYMKKMKRDFDFSRVTNHLWSLLASRRISTWKKPLIFWSRQGSRHTHKESTISVPGGIHALLKYLGLQ